LSRYQLFIDFDGTITENDVGYEFFKRFTHGKTEAKVRMYRNGEINAIEVLQYECDIYNENPASESEVSEFINSQKIRAGFQDLVKFARHSRLNLTVLSAGFDFYIKPIMKRFGFDSIDVLATPTIISDRKLYPDFVHFNESECSRCSNCKGYQIRRLLQPDHKSIFIGDGHSDFHGALASDIVFARSFLAEMMADQDKRYLLYKDFFDIVKHLRKLDGLVSKA